MFSKAVSIFKSCEYFQDLCVFKSCVFSRVVCFQDLCVFKSCDVYSHCYFRGVLILCRLFSHLLHIHYACCSDSKMLKEQTQVVSFP